MYVLVILVFLNSMQTSKDQFHFVSKGECERVGEMLKTVSKYRTITSCQPIV